MRERQTGVIALRQTRAPHRRRVEPQATNGQANERGRQVSGRRSRHPLRKGPTQRTVLYLWIVVVSVFTLFPFYWMLVSAFRPPSVILRTNSLLPGPFSLESTRVLFEITPFTRYFVNSVVVSILVTVLTLALVTPTSYVLSKMGGRVAAITGFSVLLAYMFPEVLRVIPMYVILVNLQLDNTLAGLVLGLLSTAMPLGLWLMTSFFRTLPHEVEQAARVDGASWSQVFLRVALPLARPGVLTVGLFSFILSWTDYVFALTLIRDEAQKTLPLGLASLFGKFDSSWGVTMTGSVLTTFPVMIVVAMVTRYFVSGLTLGATKG